MSFLFYFVFLFSFIEIYSDNYITFITNQNGNHLNTDLTISTINKGNGIPIRISINFSYFVLLNKDFWIETNEFTLYNISKSQSAKYFDATKSVTVCFKKYNNIQARGYNTTDLINFYNSSSSTNATFIYLTNPLSYNMSV